MSSIGRHVASPRRTLLYTGLLLLVALVTLGLVASQIPRARAQDVGSVANPNDTYYSENGQCYVQTVAATGLDGAGAEEFISAMNDLLAKLGHQSNFTFANGTVTGTATVDCPASGPTITKTIINNWVKPAVGVVGGLVLVIASALAITATYQKITGHPVAEQSTLAKSITALGGFLSTALLTYLTSNGNWQATLSSAVSAVFTTYLVAAYGFGGLQTILQNWVGAAFTFAANLAVGGANAASSAIAALRGDTVQTVAQVRA
ncbi:MAG TPA: hypothetical protein VJT31_11055 [Rugosimonospora sp.]|nr:hypothetical protein [Rugosimonospora sp.]